MQEGSNDYFFDVPVLAPELEASQEELLPAKVMEQFEQMNLSLDEPTVLQGSVPVDDDNEPAPENVVP